MRQYTVYCHTTPSQKRYIGITSTSLAQRWSNGNGYSKNYHFARAIKKYGWDRIEHSVIYTGLTEEQAKNAERMLISLFRTTDREYGYNLREGGDGAFSEESRRKMSRSRMGNRNNEGNNLKQSTKEKISKSLREYYSTHDGTFLGKHHTEETKRKLSQREITEETRKKLSANHVNVSGANNPSSRSVASYTSDGTMLKKYEYAKKAADELGVDLSSIIKACRGKQKTCAGLIWKYVD